MVGEGVKNGDAAPNSGEILRGRIRWLGVDDWGYVGPTYDRRF